MSILTVMGTYSKSQYLFVILLFIVFPCAVWILSRLLDKNKGELTAPATVLSHRLELSHAGGAWSDNWNRLVTFQLRDGSELELYTTKQDYETLTDGQSGQLTWEKDLFYHFDPDIPQ